MSALKYGINLLSNAGQQQIQFGMLTPNPSINEEARIYLEGDVPPAFSLLLSSGMTRIGVGTWIVEYRSNVLPAVQIGKFYVPDPDAICDGDTDSDWSLTRMSDRLRIYNNFSNLYKATINNGATTKQVNSPQGGSWAAEYSNSELQLEGFSIVVPTIKTRRIICQMLQAENMYIGEDSFSSLVVDYEKTDPSTVGGSDGTITLFVAGGSGSRTFVWGDGPTTQNRAGLAAGTYQVTVTDTVTGQIVITTIQINDPAPPIVDGSFIDVPIANSLMFVTNGPIDDCDNPQMLDNRLLCDQEFEGYEKTNYFQKINRCDVRVTQFNSDYSLFKAQLFDYVTAELIKTFDVEVKEQNINKTIDFGVVLRNNPELFGTTRVYFAAGPPPVPLSVGDVIQIINNLAGLDGTYTILGIFTDLSYGYQYFTINIPFPPGLTNSNATGRFFVNSENFNVYEVAAAFTDVPDGNYFIRIMCLTASGDPTIHYSTSEPINVAERHRGTNLIEYRNVDNAYGFTWTTGYIGAIRVESNLVPRIGGGERSNSRNADDSLVKVNGKRRRILDFKTVQLPPYLHEKLGIAFECDEWRVNKVSFQSSEGYGEPTYPDLVMLGSSGLKIEQQNWLGSYNSDDIGSVDNGGFITTQQGFIKR